MKKTLSILNVLILIFLININVNSQPPRGERPSATEMAEKTVTDLAKEVALTDDEISSIKTIFTDFFTKMDTMHKNGSRPEHSEMEKLVSERDENVKEVISEEKFEAYTKFMENNMKSPEGEGPPPRH